MDHIRTLLPKVLNKRGLHSQAQAAQVCFLANDWLQANAPHVAEFLHPRRVQNTELYIVADNSIAAQECQQIRADLLAFLDAEGFQGQIKAIRVQR